MTVADQSIDQRLAGLAHYDFRYIHPQIRFGTASDRYAGWIGTIYPESWQASVTTRQKRLGKRSFKESLVPTESTVDFFRHYSVLECDFTFYRALIEPDGTPSTNYGVLQRYLEHAPQTAKFLVKAPQIFCTPFLHGRGHNPDYLDAQAYNEQFGRPLVKLMGEQLAGVIFEQGYQSVKASPSDEENVARLDRFFDQTRSSAQVHLEIRSPHMLTPLFFDWLETTGLGYVYSHWTWLPSIKTQWEKSRRFTAADSNVVLRLLTPRKVTYADAYALAYPFDRVVPELTQAYGAAAMIDESVALAVKAIDANATIDIVANNRAWGTAPELSVEIARRLLEFERKQRQG